MSKRRTEPLDYVRTCQVCGRVYFSPHGRGMYCSTLCKDRAYKGIAFAIKTCPVCGKEFRTCDGKRRFCSPECARKGHWHERLVETCVVCGKPLPRRAGSHKTCSQECLEINERRKKAEWMRKHRKKAERKPLQVIERACQFCGKKFVTTNVRKVFCSRVCVSAHYHALRKLFPPFRCICRECGREFGSRSETQKFCCCSCAQKFQHKMGLRAMDAQVKAAIGTWQYSGMDYDAEADADMIYGNMIAM